MPPVYASDQYFNWDVSGGSLWRSLGGVTGGRMREGYTSRTRRYVSRRRRKKPGRNEYSGNIACDLMSDSLAFFEAGCIYTALDVLTAVKFDADDGGGEKIHDPAYVSEWEIAIASDDCAKLTFSWLGVALGSGGAGEAVDETDLEAYEDYEVTVELDGLPLDLLKLSIKGKNPASVQNYVSNGTPTIKRDPTGLTVGAVPEYTVDITCDSPPTVDMRPDCPTNTHVLTVDLTNTCAVSPGTKRITVANLGWEGTPGRDFDPNTDKPIPWEGTLEQDDYSRILVATV